MSPRVILGFEKQHELFWVDRGWLCSVSCFGAGDIPGGSRKEGSGLGPWEVLGGVRSIPLSPSSLLIVPGSASVCRSSHGAKGFYLPTARLELLPYAVHHSWGSTQSSGGGAGIPFSVQSYLVLKQKVRPSSHLPTFVTQDRRGSKCLGGC